MNTAMHTGNMTCAHGMPWSQSCPLCGRDTAIPYQPFMIPPTPSPRVLPVNVPLSLLGVTVVMVDGEGNVRIKKDQPMPDNWHDN